MNSTVAAQLDGAHLLRTESRPQMAKADLRKAEIEAWRQRIGKAVERTRLLCGKTLQEFAHLIDRDDRQVAKWINGKERPQLDALFAVDDVRAAFFLALAESAPSDIAITTQITVLRRSA